jgi:hypothetical protein
MPKRQRRSSAEVVQINSDGTAIVEQEGKRYCWYIPEGVVLNRLTDVNEYDMMIIHNCEHRAMLEIVDVRSDETYIRQEINPLSHKDVEEWVVDTE